jgi:hypothetical protein
VWLFPATYVIHLAEEYFAGDGFPAWAERTIGVNLDVATFFAWNAFALALVCVGAILVDRHRRLRWIEIGLAIAILGNAAAHAIASIATGSYSPGLITGVLIWAPLGALRFRVAFLESSRRGRWVGMAMGLAAGFSTLAVLAWAACS